MIQGAWCLNKKVEKKIDILKMLILRRLGKYFMDRTEDKVKQYSKNLN